MIKKNLVVIFLLVLNACEPFFEHVNSDNNYQVIDPLPEEISEPEVENGSSSRAFVANEEESNEESQNLFQAVIEGLIMDIGSSEEKVMAALNNPDRNPKLAQAIENIQTGFVKVYGEKAVHYIDDYFESTIENLSGLSIVAIPLLRFVQGSVKEAFEDYKVSSDAKKMGIDPFMEKWLELAAVETRNPWFNPFKSANQNTMLSIWKDYKDKDALLFGKDNERIPVCVAARANNAYMLGIFLNYLEEMQKSDDLLYKNVLAKMIELPCDLIALLKANSRSASAKHFLTLFSL